VTQALEAAVREDVSLRRALPHDFHRVMGAPFAGAPGAAARRAELGATARALMAAVSARVDLDEAADERARAFIHERLPPMLPPGPADPRQLADPALDVEEALAAEREAAADALEPDSRVRLVRGGVARVRMEGELAVLYHCADNARDYHGVPPAPGAARLFSDETPHGRGRELSAARGRAGAAHLSHARTARRCAREELRDLDGR